MSLLGELDPLPLRPRRVLVNGTSGSGKTSWARRIAEVIDAPHHEIDGLFHGPGWHRRPEFEADVRAFSAAPAWVTEWQYPAARPLLLARADLMVWLDLPPAVVMRQLVARTIGRRVRRTELWNGNTEPALRTIFSDPDHIIRWGWKTRHDARDRVLALRRDRPDFPVVRLTSHEDARRWLDGPLRAAVART